MEQANASDFLEKSGYSLCSITYVPEGSSHDIFFFTTDQGNEYVARFEKKGLHDFNGVRRDFHYNGVILLEREAYLCNLVRNAGLPAPKIEKIIKTPEVSCIVAERMPGVRWNTFLEQKNYSREAFISSMRFLAEDLAKAQQVVFDSYGNVMSNGLIDPMGITSFAERVNQIMQLKLGREEQKKAVTSQQLHTIKNYFQMSLSSIEEKLKEYQQKPVLVLADLHATNLLVDNNGKPSGHIDLEFCQAGMPILEFNLVQLQLLNYFDVDTFEEARTAFFSSFIRAGGKYDREDSVNSELDKILSAGRMLTCVTGYFGVKDGLRDTWSERCKDLLFQIIDRGTVDYIAFADIMREKTKQPKTPSLP